MSILLVIVTLFAIINNVYFIYIVNKRNLVTYTSVPRKELALMQYIGFAVTVLCIIATVKSLM